MRASDRQKLPAKLTPTPIRLLLPLLAGALSACAHGPTLAPSSNTGHPLNWLTGCWQTGDETVEETWVLSRQGDQLFGHSVTAKNGVRVFFEMMRIDFEDTATTFSAYPRGMGPTVFESVDQHSSVIAFINPENDYPQRISYSRVNDELKAEISLLDGSRPAGWVYRPCSRSSPLHR